MTDNAINFRLYKHEVQELLDYFERSFGVVSPSRDIELVRSSLLRINREFEDSAKKKFEVLTH